MEIVKLATRNNRVNEQEALRLAEKKGLRLLSSKELQDITEDNKLLKQYKDCFPCRSGTKISYKKGETEAIIQHPGEKPKKIKFPLDDGYYKVGEDGIPNGAKSDSSDKSARYLCRWQDEDYEGLVVRFCGGFSLGRRGVGCYYGPSLRYGVLGTIQKKHKHVWKTICEVCGEKRK